MRKGKVKFLKLLTLTVNFVPISRHWSNLSAPFARAREMLIHYPLIIYVLVHTLGTLQSCQCARRV